MPRINTYYANISLKKKCKPVSIKPEQIYLDKNLEDKESFYRIEEFEASLLEAEEMRLEEEDELPLEEEVPMEK